jgi:hypothetical protein
MRNLSRVCHIGDIDTKSPAVFRAANESYEGNGLSISVTPHAWRKIAQLGGFDTFILEKDNPRFFDALDKSLRKDALQWCIESGFISKTTWWRAFQTSEDGEELYFEFRNKASALAQVDNIDDIKPVRGYMIAGVMIDYFQDGMAVPHVHAEDYAVIWYAEAAGFDGVWWEEDFNPNGFSAPRGVIFQGKLEEWKIIRSSNFNGPNDLDDY